MKTPDANGWMPIASAPHATDVLLWIPATEQTPGYVECGYASGGERVGAYSSRWAHGRATAWQFVPHPPVQSA